MKWYCSNENGSKQLNFYVNYIIFDVTSIGFFQYDEKDTTERKIYSIAVESHHIVASPKGSAVVATIRPSVRLWLIQFHVVFPSLPIHTIGEGLIELEDLLLLQRIPDK